MLTEKRGDCHAKKLHMQGGLSQKRTRARGREIKFMDGTLTK